MALQVGSEGLAERFDIGIQQFGVGRAADVVLTENGGFQHVGSLL